MNSCPQYHGGVTLRDKYSLLSTDSIYREETYQVSLWILSVTPKILLQSFQATNRAITPLMAGLAELVRATEGFSQHYAWFIHLAKVVSITLDSHNG